MQSAVGKRYLTVAADETDWEFLDFAKNNSTKFVYAQNILEKLE